MIRIAITGPESSGKTTLCEALAEQYDVPFIEEYARGYLENNNGEYSVGDLDIITQKHSENIQKSQNSIQIVDTDFLVMEIWSDVKFGIVSSEIQKRVFEDIFDLHILCSPDMPWEEDPLRENPNDRELLFEKYLKRLKELNRTFLIVEGSHLARLKKSIEAIDKLLK